MRAVRPVKVDNETMMVTMEFRPDRLNVETVGFQLTIVKLLGAN